MGERNAWWSAAVWAGLAAVLLAFSWYSLRYDGASRFGRFHDDTLYWTAARSMAAGDGARLPSVPGEPALTKYPPLYPWLLSWVWAAAPEYPANLRWATGLSTGFAAAGLGLWFLYLRRWDGLRDGGALVSVAVAASCDVLLAHSCGVLSEALFFLLAAGALVLAERSAWGAGLLAGLATLTRTVGLGVVGAIGLHLALGRRWRALTTFAAAAGALVGAGYWLRPERARPADGVAEGFRQTWLYYTDYVGFWLASTPDLETLWTVLRMNAIELLESPAFLLLGTPPAAAWGSTLWIVMTVAMVAGLVRQARADRARAAHWALLSQVPFVLLWNFEIADRLLLFLVPLFAAGLYLEGRHAALGFWRSFRVGPAVDRVVSGCGLAVLALGVVLWGGRTADRLAQAGPADNDYFERYAGLDVWLRTTGPDARFVAIDDAFLYLLTGRQGMWPLAPTTDLGLNVHPERLDAQMARMADVAEAIDARYVVWTANDYKHALPIAAGWTAWAEQYCPVWTGDEARVFDRTCRALGAGDVVLEQHDAGRVDDVPGEGEADAVGEPRRQLQAGAE